MVKGDWLLFIVFKYDPDDYRSAEEGTDGRDRPGACSQRANEIAYQQQAGANECGSRKGNAVVRGLEDSSCHMRYGYANESDRSTEGRYSSGQESGSKDDEEACTLYVNTESPCIVFAQKQSVEGFEAKESEQESES